MATDVDPHANPGGGPPPPPPPLEPAPEPAPPSGGGSLLDQLVDRRDALAHDVEEEFEVPNNAGILFVNYRLLPWRQVRQMAELVTQGRGAERELHAAADFLAAACLEVYLRSPSTGDREDWPGRDPALPVRYTPELLEYLKITPPPNCKPRDVIRLVFQRDLAVSAHQAEVMRWMEGANARVNAEFAGG